MLSSVTSAISSVALAVSHGITYTLILASESSGSGLLSLLFMAVDGLRSLAQLLLDTVLDKVVSAATAAGDFLVELLPRVATGVFEAAIELVKKVVDVLKEMIDLIIWTVWEIIVYSIWSSCHGVFLLILERVKRD